MKQDRLIGCMALVGWIVTGCADGPEVQVPLDEAHSGDAELAPFEMDDRHQLVPEDFEPSPYASFGSLDTLSQYAAKCDAATGVTVPDFNCEDGTVVPTTHHAGGTCDRPNRLEKECDPGSHFRVLTDTPDAFVVAHCRKQGLAAGRYGDIAVIQHNRKNGATCFYQALGNLDGDVKAPSRGEGAWPWYSPGDTAGIRCVRCHDNGPLIRSPYLTQLTGLDKLPGAGDPLFNRDQPYSFVGSDFGSWKAYKIEVGGNPCNGCHRMGTSNMFGFDDGTGLDLGVRSTATSEAAKNPHSADSPIWMTPGQTVFDPVIGPINAAAAQEIRACALQRIQNPLPASSACRITQYTSSSVQSHSKSFGGNIFAEDHYYVTPDLCAPGAVRSGPLVTQWSSNLGGFCAFDFWYSPEDPHDCRAIIHARTGGGWFGGTCVSSVEGITAPLPLNLAAGKPASQSSTPAWGTDAKRAVDGKTEGNWYIGSVTHTEIEARPWWQVDLGAVQDLGEVVLYNRTDCCSDRLADFDVLVSNDGSAWRTAAGFTGPAPARTALSLRASGRFVRVRLRGTNYLSLAEVQVFAPRNLAALKETTQSSLPSWGAGASRAVDGNTDGNWYNGSVTHTELEAQPWWQVDLGAVQELDEVVLYNRTDCCSDRLADFDVLVSRNGTSWLTVASFTGPAPARTALSFRASGRFVRVRLRGTNYLSLAEVQVFAPRNLAAGKPATQSSTPAWGGAAARAVDGNTDGNWYNGSVTHTDLEAQPWWQVDLGAATEIGEVVVHNRTDCCGDRLADLELQLSNDGISWQTESSYPGSLPPRMEFAVHAWARFVRLRLRGANYLSLAEVRVYGPQNLAAGKPATQSSTPAWGGAAARAVDGNTDGNWYNGSVTHTELEAQPWWQVDLGAVKSVGEVILYNRTDCCSTRLSDFDLQISNDGIHWQTRVVVPGAVADRLVLAVDASTRFVRVRLHGTDYLSLSEVRVFSPSWS